MRRLTVLACLLAFALAASAGFAAYPGASREADRAVGRRGRHRRDLPARSPSSCRSTSAQTVVIANVTGASGTAGAREAKGSPPDGYTLYAVHDYIHSTYYTGVADVAYTDFEPICSVSNDPVGPHREPEDEVVVLAGAAGRRQGAARPDHGGGHARLDQPLLPRPDREGGRHQVQVRLLRGPGAAHERDPGRPHRPDRLQPHPEGQGGRGPAQVPRGRHREAAARRAQRAHAQGAGRERGLRGDPRDHGAQGHAGRRHRQARGRLPEGRPPRRSSPRTWPSRAPSSDSWTARATASSSSRTTI